MEKINDEQPIARAALIGLLLTPPSLRPLPQPSRAFSIRGVGGGWRVACTLRHSLLALESAATLDVGNPFDSNLSPVSLPHTNMEILERQSTITDISYVYIYIPHNLLEIANP